MVLDDVVVGVSSGTDVVVVDASPVVDVDVEVEVEVEVDAAGGTVEEVDPVVDVGASVVVVVTGPAIVVDTLPTAVTVELGAEVVVLGARTDVTTTSSLPSFTIASTFGASSWIKVARWMATSGAASEIEEGCWVVDDSPWFDESDLAASLSTRGVRTTTCAARIAVSTIRLLMPPPRDRPSSTQRQTTCAISAQRWRDRHMHNLPSSPKSAEERRSLGPWPPPA
ncbi:MAG: hypothetical protein GY708_06790 [Actinomycetia bacterium]|nr:hypothetical protein [Actinomycetes bacterium]